MNTLFTPWLNLPLWAVWHRVLPVEHLTLEDKPLAEVVLKVAPDATPPDGFPYGLHLRQTPEGVEVAPAARNLRNPRGEIGGGWVAWQNALIDDPERQPVGWAAKPNTIPKLNSTRCLVLGFLRQPNLRICLLKMADYFDVASVFIA